ncbi:MAG TPA: 2-amino-4-hydroxy-6-hydroxymethyldihydropteridine diphosphokinase [Burkholderiales bacterium]|nr:2-amino-4-hydroxy-6-hydroxymethyldihydropteridine diphosphokinase [Burkholderiales bacterium]
MTVAFVGLGANLGEPQRQVQQAFRELDAIAHTRVVRTSSLYRSEPLGFADQPRFVNAVAQVETGLPAGRLLAELQAVEARHGRSRSFANAPRTLDLDLLLFGNVVIDTASLQVPHPRMHERAFVLLPLLEIAPDVAIPGQGPARLLLEKCTNQGVEKLD